jgi:diacylglycerol kinase family enzyme
VAAVEQILANRRHVVVRRTETAAALPQALAELAHAGVNVLAVNGGDGTLQMALNALLHEGSPFQRRPLLAILPGGTTNMIAYDVGSHRKPHEELKRLLARLEAGTLVESILFRPVMELTGGDASHVAHGFFFGTAGVYEATMANRAGIDAIGGRDGIGPAWRLMSIAGSVLLGRDPLQPVPIRVDVDGQTGIERPYLAIFGATMERLSLGMRPFWGSAGSGAIRMTLIRKGARGLLRHAPSILRGREHPALSAENGYESLRAHRLSFEFSGGFMLDGEAFHASPGRPIVVTSSQHVAFVRG